jgi:hypothetical protein
MRSPPLSRWHRVMRVWPFPTFAVIGFAACTTSLHYLYPKNLQGFSLPPGCPSASPPGSATQLTACLEGIEFDTAEFVGDEQRLMIRDSVPGSGPPCFEDPKYTCRYGPLAKVEPVKGAELYSDAALAQGRIIARIYLRAGETQRYSKFDLAPGDTTYWWVNTALSKSVFVRRAGRTADVATKQTGLRRTPHPPGSFQQAVVRWVWDPKDETLNGGCGGHCCKP